jgi:hypothetical protein
MSYYRYNKRYNKEDYSDNYSDDYDYSEDEYEPTTSLAWYVITFKDKPKLHQKHVISETYSYKTAKNGCQYLAHLLCFKQPVDEFYIQKLYPSATSITIPSDILKCWVYINGKELHY